jgi:hypothetical protein
MSISTGSPAAPTPATASSRNRSIGTVLPIEPGLYLVQGAAGEYLVAEGRATWWCECPWFRYHCRGTSERCKHICWARAWKERARSDTGDTGGK